MNTLVVLDASVVLAFINKEGDYQALSSLFRNSIMSSINVAEVVCVLTARHKVPTNDVKRIIEQLIEQVIIFNADHAYLMAEIELINKNEGLGLSFGDKACLVLGKYLNLPVYTADRTWKKVDSLGINVELIR